MLLACIHTWSLENLPFPWDDDDFLRLLSRTVVPTPRQVSSSGDKVLEVQDR